MVQITANLKDMFGAAVTQGSVTIQLCGSGSTMPRVAGTGLVAKTGQVEVSPNASGGISASVYANSDITPNTTYYTFTVRDDNGDVVMTEAYQFNTANASVDLSNATPYSC